MSGSSGFVQIELSQSIDANIGIESYQFDRPVQSSHFADDERIFDRSISECDSEYTENSEGYFGNGEW